MNHKLPELIENITRITCKKNQTDAQRKSLAAKCTEENSPTRILTHAHTDGSATKTTENDGVLLNNGEHKKLSLATGIFFSNYKAETETLKTAAEVLLSEETN